MPQTNVLNKKEQGSVDERVIAAQMAEGKNKARNEQSNPEQAPGESAEKNQKFDDADFNSNDAADQMQDDKKTRRKELAERAQKMMAPEEINVFGKTIQLGTSRALKWAWYALIPSWGVSILYINIHVILSSYFGEKFFCKLGDEWLPPQAAATGETGKAVSGFAGILEKIVLIFLDSILFMILIYIAGLFIDLEKLSKIGQEVATSTPK
ncbi:MAG: hypothetical protein PHT51_04250 [Patescibacteria group bacterium]|nr:hypothetical protein [Patescibacteria group bacterium]MDD4610748.1 hypothetical protein [Patescibacteria group bacterium]